jgi:hypothetical protein
MSYRSLTATGSSPGTFLPDRPYQITRNAEGQLEFEPEEGTVALSDATRMRFPYERDPLKRMRLAIEEFQSEEGSSSTITLPGSLGRRVSNASQMSRPESPYGRKSRSRTRRRRAYSPNERKIVAQNRGKVCAMHRANHGKVSLFSEFHRIFF